MNALANVMALSGLAVFVMLTVASFFSKDDLKEANESY